MQLVKGLEANYFGLLLVLGMAIIFFLKAELNLDLDFLDCEIEDKLFFYLFPFVHILHHQALVCFYFVQDERLKKLVESNNSVEDWQTIAESFPNRSDIQCQHRWHKVLSPDLIKGPWTKEVKV